MTERGHYSQGDLEEALRVAGVSNGDTVFVHASLGRLGYPDPGPSMDARPDPERAGLAAPVPVEAACGVVYRALRAVIGGRGTLVVPTYTYSIGAGQPFAVEETPSGVGPLTEYVRRLPGAIRSAEPMLSVAGIGPLAARLTQELPHTSYGGDSLYDRLCDVDAKLCCLGLDLHWATVRHFIEERARVPFRFLKAFTGSVREHGAERRERWLYFAAPRLPECAPDGRALARVAHARGLCRVAPVGRGELRVIGCRQYLALGLEALARDPWLSAKGPPLDLETMWSREDARVGARAPAVVLPRDADAPTIVSALAPLRRDVVSSGAEASMRALGRHIPLDLLRIPSGHACGGDIVPEKWTLHEARVETTEGRVVLSSDDDPRRVPSYARAFEGVVPRDVLLGHVHVDETDRETVPFVSLRADPDWGFCCTVREREALDSERYRVVLRADVSFGALVVGQATLSGQSSREILLAAHLGSPGSADEGLSGVAVLVTLFERLRALPRRYTYRFVIAPAEIGFSAWLSSRPPGLHEVVAGLALDRIGSTLPLVLTATGRGDLRATAANVLARASGRVVTLSPSSGDGGDFAALATQGFPLFVLQRQSARARQVDVQLAGRDRTALAQSAAVSLELLQNWDTLQHAAEKGPSASLVPSAARSTYSEYASRAAIGHRLASGPF